MPLIFGKKKLWLLTVNFPSECSKIERLSVGFFFLFSFFSPRPLNINQYKASSRSCCQCVLLCYFKRLLEDTSKIKGLVSMEKWGRSFLPIQSKADTSFLVDKWCLMSKCYDLLLNEKKYLYTSKALCCLCYECILH